MSGIRERWPPQGLPSPIQSGLLANRPAFGNAGHFYWATDTQMLYYDTGAAWEAPDHAFLENVLFAQHHDHYARILWDWLSAGAAQVANAAIGDWSAADRVMLQALQVPFTVTIDRLAYGVASVGAGNARMGIYEDNGDTPQGGDLLEESASIAKPAGGEWHELPIADLQLAPGLYWIALLSDEAVSKLYLTWMSNMAGTLRGHGYDLAYGVFTDPCPAIFNDEVPCMYVRVKSIP